MADKYFRIVSVIVNVCPRPFRQLLIDMARNESNNKGIPFTDIDNYLKHHSTNVLVNSRFTRDQLNLVYPPPPTKAKTSDWDLTLLFVLLETLFGKVLGPAVITCIKKLRKIRNELQHKATTLVISDTEFRKIWKDISTETATLANIIGGPKYEKEIKIEIMEVENSFMSTLGVVLLKWYNSVILETKVSTDQIMEDTQQMRALLEGTAVKRKRRSGNFRITKSTCRDTDFSPPERALSQISMRLSGNNFVIISGYGNGKHLHVAMVAIQRLNLDDSGCAEINFPEELLSINGDEVGLLLLQSSFLSNLLGKETEFIFYTLNRLQYHITHSDNPIKVVILADRIVLEKFKDQHQHWLLTTAINIDTPTSQDDPEYLSMNDEDKLSDTSRSMLGWSHLFLQEREMTFQDETFLRTAEETFRKHNVVVCIGELACARSALAVYLAKLNRSNACIVITDPDDIKYVELGRIDVLVILDFAGRFRYDEAKVYKWLEKFDLLYDAVQKRIISVIITCQESRLRMCRDETASHIILDQTIQIPKDMVITPRKGYRENALISGDRGQSCTFGQEEAEGEGRSSVIVNDAVTVPIVVEPVEEDRMCQTDFEAMDVEIKHHNITQNDDGDDHDSCVWGICQLQDSSFVLLEYYKQKIKQFDANFKFIKCLSVTGPAKSICCTGLDQITIAFEKAVTVLNLKTEKCTSLQTDISPDMLTSDMKKLFIMDKTSKTINVYDLNSFSFLEVINVPVVETYSPAFCSNFVISRSGQKFYIMYLNIIKCFNKHGVVLATYEMPVHVETRKYRKFTETVMCQADEDVLLFIAQGSKEQIKERFIFLDSHLNEVQKGDIQSEINKKPGDIQSMNSKKPTVMCYDRHGKRAILGYRQGPVVTVVQFRTH